MLGCYGNLVVKDPAKIVWTSDDGKANTLRFVGYSKDFSSRKQEKPKHTYLVDLIVNSEEDKVAFMNSIVPGAICYIIHGKLCSLERSNKVKVNVRPGGMTIISEL